MKKLPEIILLGAAVAVLSSCGNAKEQMGLTHRAPDEFAVVKRAPLAMPPDYSLRPPSPGAPRPQEEAVGDQARAVVFGGEQPAPARASAPDSTEDFILRETGASAADPAIRRTVDIEAATIKDDDRPVAEKLLGWTKKGDKEGPASVVDAAAEAERLKKNEEEGKPVTEGQTPTKTQ